MKTIFALLIAGLTIGCSEVNVRHTTVQTPQCNLATMNLADYMRLQTKTGVIYVHKVQNYVCEVSNAK